MGQKEFSQYMPPGTRFVDESKEPIKLKGVKVIYAEKVGRNGFIYSDSELKMGIDWWKKMVSLDPTHRYIFIKHPKDEDEETYMLIAGYIEDLYYDNSEGCLKADIELLPTVWGLFIAWLINKGYPVATSLRGSGKSKNDYYEYNGKTIKVKRRYNIKIEGFDFVIFPSFMVTQITKDNMESIKENRKINDVINEFIESNKNFINDNEYRIFESFQKPKNNKINDGGIDMNLDEKKKSLSVEIDQLEKDIADKKSILTKIESELVSKSDELETFNKLISKKSDVEKRLSEIENELKNKNKLLEDINSKISDLENNSAIFGDKIFNSNNKPKIRFIDISEGYSKRSINEINVDKIRKILSLADVEDKSSFSVNDKIYPVFDLVASSSKEYDLDALFNPNLLNYFYNNFMISIDSCEKDKVADYLKFFKNHFKKLEDLNIIKNNISSKLDKLSNIIPKIESEDSDFMKILGIVVNSDKFDVSKIKEQTDSLKIDKNKAGDILLKIAHLIASQLSEEDLSSLADVDLKGVFEGENQTNTEEGDEYSLSDFLKELLINPDGSKSPFADFYGIDNGDQLYSLFGDARTKLQEGNFEEGLEPVRNAVLTWTAIMTNESDGDVKGSLKTAFDVIEYILSNYNELKDEFNLDLSVANESNENEPVNEENKKFGEKTNKNIDEEEKMFEEIKKMILDRFEVKEDIDKENILDVLATVLDDYVDIKSKYEELSNENKEKFEDLKKAKIEELKGMGVKEEVINAFFDGIEDKESLEKEYTKIKLLVVKEENKGEGGEENKGEGGEENKGEENKGEGGEENLNNENDEKINESRKGKSVVDNDNKEDSLSNFEKLLNSV